MKYLSLHWLNLLDVAYHHWHLGMFQVETFSERPWHRMEMQGIHEASL